MLRRLKDPRVGFQLQLALGDLFSIDCELRWLEASLLSEHYASIIRSVRRIGVVG